MSALLPILFVVALVTGYRELHWAFLALSAVALLVMWGARAFVAQARTTMTLVYAALMIVSLTAAVWFTQPLLDGTTNDPNQHEEDLYAGLFDRNVTASEVEKYGAQGSHAGEPSSVPTENAHSQAQAQLELFMNSWMSLDYNAMLSYCAPVWVNQQADPQHAIFKIRGTSTPVDFDITAGTGSDANDSRTLTMVAQIDKGTGRTPQKYRYEVLMLRVNGVWYVDPASLSSATEIKEVTAPVVTPTLMPTVPPDAEQVLYYNPDGGSFYHASPNCGRVALKYQPLKGTFKYKQLNESAYKDLKPCTSCSAPGRT